MEDFLKDAERDRKRRRLDGQAQAVSSSALTSRAPISPPRRRAVLIGDSESADIVSSSGTSDIAPVPPIMSQPEITTNDQSIIKSPFQLTWIQDLPEKLNVDTLTLNDMIGDPLISECWEFNYLHDVDFLMSSFDKDIQHLVQVHIIHGFWRHEDSPGQTIRAQAAKYANVTAHTAYMPEAYGTHHTKMMVLFRHDDTAQVIIHTANMIQQDWRNLSQAVWRSPILPRCKQPKISQPVQTSALGSGENFKIDFLAYLASYNSRRPVCKALIDKLVDFDFTAIRGCLIGSVPGRHDIDSERSTLWGWPAVRNALSSIPCSPKSTLVAQISSIATLGVTDAWLSKTLFSALSSSCNRASKPVVKIIFPTADEIRRSLDGYNSGASIHIKTQTGPQQKQLAYLKPLLHHWAGDGAHHTSDTTSENVKEAGRKRAAPHIKTYVRYKQGMGGIDWALVTSANISKQAWGEAANKSGEVRIQSYELGVLVWPGLWDKDQRGSGNPKMVPCFGKDIPEVNNKDDGEDTNVVAGFRMPYDIPLTKYAEDDVPWCATASHEEPDWKGQVYNVD